MKEVGTISTRVGLADALDRYREAAGAANVLTGQVERAFHAADFVGEAAVLPIAVVRVRSTAAVAAVMRAAAAAGHSVVGRGGGMSYTRAHVPDRADTIVLDLGGIDSIELHAEDRYVICGAGVTWAQLSEAVDGTGLWAGHLGTLSGRHATVGGGVSQQVGGLTATTLTSVVLGIEAVLADGRVVRTGSWAPHDGEPFSRDFGPDLSGLFCCDSGAMGIKTRISLRLDPLPACAYECFDFTDKTSLLDALVELGRAGIASTAFGTERTVIDQMRTTPTPSRAEVVALARQVIGSAKPRWRGVRALVRAGRPSMSYLDAVSNVLAVVVDGPDSAAANRLARRVRGIANKNGGCRIPSALAIGLRHKPFGPIDPLMFGAGGESTVPSNMLVPLSRARTLCLALDDVLAASRTQQDAHGIFVSYNWLLVGHLFGVEPLICFPGRPGPYRLHWASEAQRACLATGDRGQPEAMAVAMDLRKRMIDAARAVGSTHIQLGRVYPFARALAGTATWSLLEDLKSTLDRDRRINPGVLGLASQTPRAGNAH